LQAEPPASPTSGTAGEPIVVDTAAATPEATADVVESVWDGFFDAKQDPPAAAGKESDSGDAGSKKAEELPL
jgi:hypothetical protein